MKLYVCVCNGEIEEPKLILNLYIMEKVPRFTKPTIIYYYYMQGERIHKGKNGSISFIAFRDFCPDKYLFLASSVHVIVQQQMQ